jgi:hypothetical protein
MLRVQTRGIGWASEGMCKTLKRLSGEAMLLAVVFAFQPYCVLLQPATDP